jgi:acetyltransferase-like isoleucine patch superfamily enzyme
MLTNLRDRIRIEERLRYKATSAHLRRHHVEFGLNPLATGKLPLIDGRGTIRIGDNFRIDGRQFRAELTAIPGAELRLGHHVFFNQGVNVYASISVTIGDGSLFGDLVTVYDTNFHEIDEDTAPVAAPVVIEENVWLARGVLVLPGSHIGRNSVVAAGAVVTGTIPPNSLAVGSPARVHRAITASDHFRRIR